jgi:hypothetical protein
MFLQRPGSNLSMRPSSIATTAGPGSSMNTSSGGVPREAFTFATWSRDSSGVRTVSTSEPFLSAGSTTAR